MIKREETPYWKMVLINIVAVYPTLMFILTITDPVVDDLPRSMHVLIMVVILAFAVTWPVMPFLEHVLRRVQSPKPD